MARARLLLIAGAGAGASAFRGWGDELPAAIEAYALQLPGREERLTEAPYTEWRAMLDGAAAALRGWPDLPIAIFGHSLGAVIALELARWWQARRPGRLQHLFVAARPWPGKPSGERPDLDGLDDAALLEVLDRQYGSGSSSLAHPEIREIILPVLRADLRLLGSYRYQAGPPLACPVTVHAGRDDALTPASSIEGWRNETTAGFDTLWLPASHFFLESHRDDLTADIRHRLLKVTR